LQYVDDIEFSIQTSKFETKHIEEMQEEMTNHYEWTRRWKLMINPKKCETICITKRTDYPAHVFHVNGVKLNCIHAPVNAPAHCRHSIDWSMDDQADDSNGSDDEPFFDRGKFQKSEFSFKKAAKTRKKLSKSVRILGLFFDPKLTWQEQSDQVIKRVKIKLYQLCKIAYSKKYRLSAMAIWRLYSTMIQPIMEYGLAIYGNPKILKLYNVLHFKAARIALRAMKSTPRITLKTLLNIKDLQYRYDTQILKLWERSAHAPIHYLQRKTFAMWKTAIKSNPESRINRKMSTRNTPVDSNQSFNPQNLKYLKNAAFSKGFALKRAITPIEIPIKLTKNPQYMRSNPVYRTAFPKNLKVFERATNPISLESEHLVMKEEWLYSYSDGSCDPNPGPGGYGMYVEKFEKEMFEENEKHFGSVDHPTTIEYCELFAIKALLQRFLKVQQSSDSWKNHDLVGICIFSDSLFSIQAMDDEFYMEIDYYYNEVCDIFQLCNELNKHDLKVRVYKVRAHQNIDGNEKADKLAKQGSQQAKQILFENSTILFERDFIPLTVEDSYNYQNYQIYWNEARDKEIRNHLKDRHFSSIVNQTLYAINKVTNLMEIKKPTNFLKFEYFHYNSKECGIITKLRAEHAPLNAYLYYIVKVKDSPLCEVCKVDESVQHFLIDCKQYDSQRYQLRCKLWELDPYFLNPSHFNTLDILMPHTWQLHPSRKNKEFAKQREKLLQLRVSILKATASFVIQTERFKQNQQSVGS